MQRFYSNRTIILIFVPFREVGANSEGWNSARELIDHFAMLQSEIYAQGSDFLLMRPSGPVPLGPRGW